MTLTVPEAPRTQVEWLTLAETPLATVWHRGITVADLPAAFDSGFTAVATAVAQAGIAVTFPAIAVYHGDPMGTFDLEVAALLAAPLSQEVLVGEVTVVPSALAAGEYASLSHIGSYEDLGRTWGRFLEGVRADGAEGLHTWVEVYVSDPTSTEPAELRTDLAMPVRRP